MCHTDHEPSHCFFLLKMKIVSEKLNQKIIFQKAVGGDTYLNKSFDFVLLAFIFSIPFYGLMLNHSLNYVFICWCQMHSHNS